MVYLKYLVINCLSDLSRLFYFKPLVLLRNSSFNHPMSQKNIMLFSNL
jgi:hypothetical protein